MPDPSQFDLDFRPATYWAGMARATANVKGTMRRRMLDSGRAIPPQLLAESLDDETRVEVGRWHPAFMGGEYLPDHDDTEVTVARFELGATTGDVIDIRARPMADGIAYRIVDEYDTAFTCSPAISAKALTMGEFVALIDSVSDGDRTGLTGALRDFQVDFGDEPAEDIVGFVRVVSDFYPQLEAWYEAEAHEWLQRRLTP